MLQADVKSGEGSGDAAMTYCQQKKDEHRLHGKGDFQDG